MTSPADQAVLAAPPEKLMATLPAAPPPSYVSWVIWMPCPAVRLIGVFALACVNKCPARADNGNNRQIRKSAARHHPLFRLIATGFLFSWFSRSRPHPNPAPSGYSDATNIKFFFRTVYRAFI